MNILVMIRSRTVDIIKMIKVAAKKKKKKFCVPLKQWFLTFLLHGPLKLKKVSMGRMLPPPALDPLHG
jgi:hypothetical protein